MTNRKIRSILLMITLVVSGILGNPSVGYGMTKEATSSLELSAPSAILMEASTGTVIYQVASDEQRAPASITKIMSLLLIFEALEEGKIHLSDEVTTSAYAKSMGGSKVFLETGEVQTVETLIKCIVIPSGNDACVAMAEYIAASEEAFVQRMNDKAAELGMTGTHFVDCCGLTESNQHYTTAMDVAIMSKELITKYPEIYSYTNIWMEDIVHTTAQGSKTFTLSSTNKLLQLYEYTTGLKTGYTSMAKHCLSATAKRDGIDLIAVVLGAPNSESRFQDAITMLNYGFSVSRIYTDTTNQTLPSVTIMGGVLEVADVSYQKGFTYLDTTGADLSTIQREIILNENIEAPVEVGQEAGKVSYLLNGKEIGSVPITFATKVSRAVYKDYCIKVVYKYLFS